MEKSEQKDGILKQIRGGLVVSCQALPEEPLHSSFIMGRMAVAAAKGGACGIRANTQSDIREIKGLVNLPVIGIVKKDFEGSLVYITPTIEEVDELVEAGCEIIAMDATDRLRPGNVELEVFFQEVRRKYPDQLFMADIATLSEGMKAAELGFDLVGTTLCGYTENTKESKLPNLELIQELRSRLTIPVVAEGGIHSPDDLKSVYGVGAYTAVVGGAITRPMEITKRFTAVLKTT